MNLRLLLLLSTAAVLRGQVSFDDILHANRQPQNWLTYSGTYSSHRYSLLDRITPANVKNLGLAWVFQAQSLEKFEATPLVVNGVMYLSRRQMTYSRWTPRRAAYFGPTSIGRQLRLGSAAAR